MERSTFSSLSGTDAAVALRSLARRFGETFRASELAGETTGADVTKSPPGGGPSPLELVQSAQRAMSSMQGATETVLNHDRPTLAEHLLDRAVRDHPDDGSRSIVTALDGLGRAAGALAERAAHVSAKDWGRTGLVGSTSVSALELVQEAVAAARTYLDELGPALDSLRRAPD